jgi:hypothetical protein
MTGSTHTVASVSSTSSVSGSSCGMTVTDVVSSVHEASPVVTMLNVSGSVEMYSSTSSSELNG